MALGGGGSRYAGMAEIDPEAGLANFGGNLGFYEKTLEKFLELHIQTARKIREALIQGDGESAERLAHSMISGAGTIGATDPGRTDTRGFSTRQCQ